MVGSNQDRDEVNVYEVEQNAVIHEDDSDIDELAQSSAGKKAMEGFNKILVESGTTDSHLPISMFDLLMEEVGEGFHGDELEKQLALVDHDGTGMIAKIAFIKWYCNLVNQEVDESSQESEVAEEKAKAEKAFDVLGNGNTEIPASYFSKLLESLGTTYCEEEHVRTMKKLSMLDMTGIQVIAKNDFVVWYVDWLFGDVDSDDGDENDGKNVDLTKSAVLVASYYKTEGWGSTFKAAEGLWKCEVCMITNKPVTIKCEACKTPMPGYESSSDLGRDLRLLNNGRINVVRW
jgi:Ca2+-binding EF-hand superfamily protein